MRTAGEREGMEEVVGGVMEMEGEEEVLEEREVDNSPEKDIFKRFVFLLAFLER